MRSEYEGLAVRFWDKVVVTEGCWPWIGGVTKGRGRISFRGRTIVAPKAALLIHGVSVPDGMCVCHRCDNPNCVNPWHLFVGTIRDNTIDASKKGRLFQQDKTHCIHGHPLSGDNLLINKRGQRGCRECRRIEQRRFDARRGSPPRLGRRLPVLANLKGR